MQAYSRAVKKTAVFLAIFSFSGLFPGYARAVAVVEIFASQSACDVSSKFQDFKTATASSSEVIAPPEKSASSSETREGKEDPALAARKTLTLQILECARRDVGRLLSAVGDIPLAGASAKDLQINILTRLERAGEKITRIEKRIEETETVETAKEIARDIADWRKNEYLALVENAGVFVVWGNGEILLDKAESRILQVRQTLKSLKLHDAIEVQRAFEQAKTHSLRAEENHLKAKQGIERFGKSDDVLKYVNASLDDLRNLYASLLRLSEVVAQAVK
ncbi:MAG: hypothetical protein AAB495_04660 [Patescibacteria group bacterium]